MSATVRTVFGISNLAAARSTATGTLRSIPSRQLCTASMSSGVKSIWVTLSAPDVFSHGRALQQVKRQFFWIMQSPPAAFNPLHNFAALSADLHGSLTRHLE